MKNSSKYILLAGFFMMLSFYAAAIPPAPGGGAPPCFPGPCVPIDGGVSFLLAAAAVYGGKKLYDNQKKQD
ncbi:MAG: PID-CTERM protein-sorting domain-containing protein [Bacteroidia bacterium]